MTIQNDYTSFDTIKNKNSCKKGKSTLDTSLVIGCYCATMVISGIAYWMLYFKWRLNVPRYFFFIHFFIVNWSALMYLNKFFQTQLDRFSLELDWIVSTPLIVLALTLSACYKSLHSSKDLIAAAMGLQAIVIVTGILGLLQNPTRQHSILFSLLDALRW